MNRRRFFTGLGAVLAAASAPGIFIPKFEPVRWKVLTPEFEMPFNARQFAGKWKFVMEELEAHPGPLFTARYTSAIILPDGEVDMVCEVR